MIRPRCSWTRCGDRRRHKRDSKTRLQRRQGSRLMSILVDKKSRVIVQGLGKAGTFHATQCREYGTQVVGAVKPGKGGTTQDGFPLFNTVAEAVAKTGADASMVFVPPPAATDAILEAADAGIRV